MIPAHFSRELAAAKRREYEHRAAVHRLTRHLAAVHPRPGPAARLWRSLSSGLARLGRRRAPGAATAPVGGRPPAGAPATGIASTRTVDCCAPPCAA